MTMTANHTNVLTHPTADIRPKWQMRLIVDALYPMLRRAAEVFATDRDCEPVQVVPVLIEWLRMYPDQARDRVIACCPERRDQIVALSDSDIFDLWTSAQLWAYAQMDPERMEKVMALCGDCRNPNISQ